MGKLKKVRGFHEYKKKSEKKLFSSDAVGFGADLDSLFH
jgi:hypothetical protein